jgi:sulfonate transport system ATP-binding protein
LQERHAGGVRLQASRRPFEDTPAIDSFTRMKLQDHVSALWKKSRFTLILVTHDLEEAVAMADRIVVMRGQNGRIMTEIPVPLARPRKRSSAPFQALKEEVSLALKLP